MKIIDAFWEKKNLGVSCKEVIIEETDTTESLSELKQLQNSTEYLVIKVPSKHFDIYTALSDLGFVFIETSINFKLQLIQANLTPLQHRINVSVSYAEMETGDLEKLFSEINSGMFSTDRIIIDPYFTPEIAANRYINWISDELKRETQVYKIIYKDDAIGFFTFKTIADGIYYPFLVGLYQKYAVSGLGFTILRKPIDEAIRRKGKMISTYVSTNNLPIIRTHIQHGFNINEIYYVFIKHNQITL